MTALESGLTVTVARSLGELDALRPAWEGLQGNSVRSDPDYFSTVVASMQDTVVRPHVVLLERQGQPEAMAVARLERTRLAARIGYKTVLRPLVQSLTVVHGGFLGPAAAAPVLVEELWQALARKEADVVYLPKLRTDDALYHLARARPPSLCRARSSSPSTHRALVLPGSFEEFLASRNARSRGRIRRYPKRVLQEFGDRAAIRTYRDVEELDELFAALASISAKTYQAGLGVGFVDSEREREVTRLAMAKGWYRCDVLQIDGEERAFWSGIAYRRTFYTGLTGYDPKYRDYNLGTYVLMRLVEDLCEDASIDVVDYGFGEAEYKHTFGNDSWEEDDVTMFAPTMRGIRLNLSLAAVGAASRLVRGVADRTGLGDRVKSRWRRRLARKTAESAA